MNIFRSYKRTRFFLWVNITGLAIGLAVSIMLTLFVVNELSYDRHFANADRIVNLSSISVSEGNTNYWAINLRKAYTEVPQKVPGIELTTQIMNWYEIAVLSNGQQFDNVSLLYADPEFFQVFQTDFVEGSPESALTDSGSVVITDEQATRIFGSPAEAMGKPLNVDERDVIVTAVVKKFPVNTHFNFDAVLNIEPHAHHGGLEYFTFYLVEKGASVEDVRKGIETEYSKILKDQFREFTDDAWGTTQMMTDMYLKSEASWTLDKKNDMKFIWLLCIVSLLIMALAITNFINLFIAQGETRMKELGVRKTNGAERSDIIRQFFREVTSIVSIAFVAGIALTVILSPYFAKLVGFPVDLNQLFSPIFIACVLVLFILTIVLAASYPAFYLSRFSPLEILAKRMSLSKRKLTVVVLVFQSMVTIILLSFILIVNRQTTYLRDLPIGYNPENVAVAGNTKGTREHYDALIEELRAIPQVKMVSGAQHLVGGGASGQVIGRTEDPDKNYLIDEYRVLAGLGELMEFELIEGEFIQKDKTYDLRPLVVNQTAVKMLGLKEPVAGTRVNYNSNVEIIGVVKDFYYADPANPIKAMTLSLTWNPTPWAIYIRFNEDVSRMDAIDLLEPVFRKFDPNYVIDLTWIADVYQGKFEALDKQQRIISIASLLSLFIATIGLIATHLFTTIRRTKEIGIRRVNGASQVEIFNLLSIDIIKWIIVAGIIAIPLTYLIASSWLDSYANRANIAWFAFLLPVLLQCVIGLVVTAGISLRAVIQNPVDAIKAE